MDRSAIRRILVVLSSFFRLNLYKPSTTAQQTKPLELPVTSNKAVSHSSVHGMTVLLPDVLFLGGRKMPTSSSRGLSIFGAPNPNPDYPFTLPSAPQQSLTTTRVAIGRPFGMAKACVSWTLGKTVEWSHLSSPTTFRKEREKILSRTRRETLLEGIQRRKKQTKRRRDEKNSRGGIQEYLSVIHVLMVVVILLVLMGLLMSCASRPQTSQIAGG